MQNTKQAKYMCCMLSAQMRSIRVCFKDTLPLSFSKFHLLQLNLIYMACTSSKDSETKFFGSTLIIFEVNNIFSRLCLQTASYHKIILIQLTKSKKNCTLIDLYAKRVQYFWIGLSKILEILVWKKMVILNWVKSLSLRTGYLTHEMAKTN